MLADMEVDPTKLREIREARAYSLRELGQITGISYNTIWFIETGRRKSVHPRTVRLLAMALRVKPTDLTKKG